MTDAATPGPGALLIAARERRGLAVATLAAQLKVPLARLSALEGERWNELPDPSYTRALATAVCRVLEADAAPVLARMPGAAPAVLERVSEGLNEPLQMPGSGLQRLSRPVLGLVALILLVGVVLSLWPRDLDLGRLLERWRPMAAAETAATEPVPSVVTEPVAAPAQTVVAEPVAAPAAVVASAPVAAAASLPAPTLASAPAAPAPAVAAASVAAPPVDAGPMLRVLAREDTWIRVADAGNLSLASRLLHAGESLELAVPRPPAQIHLGNAPGAELSWRGRPQDLSGQGRVLRLTLP